jgi:hypothetical protein
MDTDADGDWDMTYLGNGQWDPPMTSMPAVGSLIDFDSNNTVDAILVDQNGDGISDGVDIGLDGTVDVQIG